MNRRLQACIAKLRFKRAVLAAAAFVIVALMVAVQPSFSLTAALNGTSGKQDQLCFRAAPQPRESAAYACAAALPQPGFAAA